MEWDSVTKRLAAKQTMTPKTGANLVGVDDFEPAGEELYLVGHFESAEAAERAKVRRLKANPSEALYLYRQGSSPGPCPWVDVPDVAHATQRRPGAG